MRDSSLSFNSPAQSGFPPPKIGRLSNYKRGEGERRLGLILVLLPWFDTEHSGKKRKEWIDLTPWENPKREGNELSRARIGGKESEPITSVALASPFCLISFFLFGEFMAFPPYVCTSLCNFKQEQTLFKDLSPLNSKRLHSDKSYNIINGRNLTPKRNLVKE